VHVVLGLLDRGHRLHRRSPHGWTALEASIAAVVPDGLVATRLHRWVSRDGAVLLASWGPAGAGPGHHLEETLLGSSVSTGHWSVRPPTLEHALRHGSGAGTVALLGASDEGLTVRTSASGAEPMYLARGRRYTAVSNRAMVAAVVAHVGGLEPDLAALPQFVCAGFAVSERTPFRGVVAIPRATLLELRRRRVGLRPSELRWRQPEGDASSADPDEVGGDLAAALVAAMAPLHGHPDPILLSLTGGKDSRLLAAAMRTAGVPFTTQTFGPEGHPDVVVGRSIAALLGVPHVHTAPRVQAEHDAPPYLEVDPLRRAADAVRLAEGMVSAYENLGSVGARRDTRPIVSGTGGELLRGGYAHYAPDTSGDGARRYLTRGFLGHLGLLQPDAGRELEVLLAPWLDATAAAPLQTLDRFYREYRMARWAAAGRSAYRVTRALVQPLFDSAVVGVSATAAIDERVSELLIFRALDRLAPPLARHPFAETRWLFETPGPHPALPDWEARNPVTTPGSHAGNRARFDWRIHYGSEVQAVFREVILDPARDHDLFRVVRRDRVEPLLAADPPRSPRLCWQLFTAAVLLSREWLAPVAPSAVTRVPVPSADPDGGEQAGPKPAVPA
jgi:hypothetical protein